MAISKQTENINRCVLGPELAAEKVIKYVPHGINENKQGPDDSSLPYILKEIEIRKLILLSKKIFEK